MDEQMIERELKPCPFCGMSKPSSKEFGGGYYIECRDCPAVIEEDTQALAIAAWNRRAAHSVMAGKVAELEMQRDSARELLVIAAARQESDHQLIRKLEGELRAALAPHPKGIE